MRSQEFVAAAAIVLAATAFGLTAAGGLAGLSSRGSTVARTAAPSLTKSIYCPAGENRQFSNIHHAWVCSTEFAPAAPK